MNKISIIDEYLKNYYPTNKIELNYTDDYSLAIAVILSAQCTDKRVNVITKKLFSLANNAKEMCKLSESEIYEIIKPCGLGNSKAKAILDLSNRWQNEFNSKLPQDFKTLTSVRGIGRKTANVLLSTIYGQNRFAVDTHVFRVCNRLGITKAKNVIDTEKQVMKLFEPSRLSSLHLQFVMFGRYVCKAQKPLCDDCKLNSVCDFYKEKKCL